MYVAVTIVHTKQKPSIIIGLVGLMFWIGVDSFLIAQVSQPQRIRFDKIDWYSSKDCGEMHTLFFLDALLSTLHQTCISNYKKLENCFNFEPLVEVSSVSNAKVPSSTYKYLL